MSETHDTRKRPEVQEGAFKAYYLTGRKEGDYMEATGLQRQTRPGIRRINKTMYEVIRTGEVLEYKTNDQKGGWSLKKTMERLTGLIRANFRADRNELFMTLTYKENMTDPKRLMKDFEKFWKRLTYRMKDRELGYISVAEPQGRGAWHLHVLVKAMDGSNLYIDNKAVSQIWGHGMTQTERIECEDCGAYFTTYFTQVQSHKWDIAEPKKEPTKAQTKASRLHFYPMGFNFYRASRNMTKPEKVTMTRKEIEREYPVLKYDKSFDIIDPETGKTVQKIERITRKKSGS